MSEIVKQKTDLRVTKTHMALCTALFALLEKTPFSKITVNDLCKTALVSRATFYMHFEDKYHLLRFALAEMQERMQAKDVEQGEAIRRMVYFAHENFGVLRNLLIEDNNHELTKLFSEAMVISTMEKLRDRQQEGHVFDVPLHVLALFISGGMAHLMMWWMTEGRDISPEEMIAHLTTLAEARENLNF